MNATKRWVVEQAATNGWFYVGHSVTSLDRATDVVRTLFGVYPVCPVHIIEQTLAPIPDLDGATEVVGERVVWESGRKETGE